MVSTLEGDVGEDIGYDGGNDGGEQSGINEESTTEGVNTHEGVDAHGSGDRGGDRDRDRIGDNGKARPKEGQGSYKHDPCDVLVYGNERSAQSATLSGELSTSPVLAQY